MASAGFPLPGIAARAVQPGTNHSCSPGQTGELCFQTPIVMSRYLHDPAATAAVLDTDGWLHSRDLGYLDEDGYVYVVGRLDDVIITGRPVGDGCGLRDLGARCAVWGQAVVAAVVRSDLSLLRQCSSTAGPASLTTNARAGWSSWTSCREMRQGR